MEASNATLEPLVENETLGEKAYFAIRNAIVSGVLQPGERITERDIAERLHVSTTPIREALRRLEQEGLVVRIPNRGVLVSDMPSVSVAELLLLQGALRGIAARLAAEKITEAKLVEIEAVLREAEPLETASAEKLLAVGDRFHALVDQASRNTTLLRFVDTVEALDPIDRLELLRKPEQARESFREHREIAAALASRDRDLAESLMRLHVLRSGHSIFKTLPDV